MNPKMADQMNAGDAPQEVAENPRFLEEMHRHNVLARIVNSLDIRSRTRLGSTCQLLRAYAQLTVIHHGGAFINGRVDELMFMFPGNGLFYRQTETGASVRRFRQQPHFLEGVNYLDLAAQNVAQVLHPNNQSTVGELNVSFINNQQCERFFHSFHENHLNVIVLSITVARTLDIIPAIRALSPGRIQNLNLMFSDDHPQSLEHLHTLPHWNQLSVMDIVSGQIHSDSLRYLSRFTTSRVICDPDIDDLIELTQSLIHSAVLDTIVITPPHGRQFMVQETAIDLGGLNIAVDAVRAEIRRLMTDNTYELLIEVERRFVQLRRVRRG